MPVSHNVPRMPPEVAAAKARLMRAMEVVVTHPALGLSTGDVQNFRSGAEEVFADPEKWPAILTLQRDAENTVRGFVMSRNPTNAEIEQAVGILKKFIYEALTKIGAFGKFAAGAASGYVSFQLLNDPAKRAAVGPLYSKLRLVFLGAAV
jgi:hypothetical protein